MTADRDIQRWPGGLDISGQPKPNAANDAAVERRRQERKQRRQWDTRDLAQLEEQRRIAALCGSSHCFICGCYHCRRWNLLRGSAA